MIIPESTEKDSQSAQASLDFHFQYPQAFQFLLSPLRVVLTTPANAEPREMRALEAVDRIGRSSEPVWITAEVGGGAVWLAQLLHDRGADGGPFTREDCDATRPPRLIDGRGTLFLCAPERLSAQHQRELLDYLSRSNLKHLEGLRTVTPYPRVVAWSQSSITELKQSARILPALAPALGKIQISVPPLRAQRDVIEPLTHVILEQIAAHEGIAPRQLTPDALETLRSHSWPGNLTELNSLLERACLLGDPDRLDIEAGDLAEVRPVPGAQDRANLAGGPREHRPRPMAEIEAEAIRASIDSNSGNLVRAARELRIGRATLYRKLKKYGIPTRAERRQLAQ